MKNFVLHLSLFLISSLTAFSQEYSVKFLDISNGLSNNSVLTIYQDSDGFMWFGTYDGLNRYDGYNFKIYRNKINDKNSLSFNTIYNIEEDKQKNIWVGGANGACVFNRKESVFYPIKYSSTDAKTKIVKDVIHQIRSVSEDLMLVASQNFGLLVYENGSISGKTLALENRNSKVEKYSYDAAVIENDSLNNCSWVYVANVGICKYNYHSKKLKIIHPLSKEVKCMKLALDGNLWLGTDEGLYLFQTQTNLLSDNYLTTTCTVTDILQDKKKEIWATTDGCGIYKVLDKNEKAISFQFANGKQFVKSNSIWSIHEDSNGNNSLTNNPFYPLQEEDDEEEEQPDSSKTTHVLAVAQIEDQEQVGASLVHAHSNESTGDLHELDDGEPVIEGGQQPQEEQPQPHEVEDSKAEDFQKAGSD